MDTSGFKSPKPRVLHEGETITSFSSWKSNMEYNLSLNNEFAPFLDSAFTWSKNKLVTNKRQRFKSGPYKQDGSSSFRSNTGSGNSHWNKQDGPSNFRGNSGNS